MKICRIAGIDIKINPLLILFSVFWLATGYWQTALMIYFALILHEGGHIIAAAAFNVKIYEITLLPFGSVARMDDIFERHPVKETIIALAGPFVSVICAMFALTAGTYFGFEEAKPAEDFCYMLAGFNLLPALPLDGGRVLRALLARSCDFGRATKLTAVIGTVLGTAMTVYGVYTFFTDKQNMLLPMLGVFVLFAALDEFKQSRFEFARCMLSRRSAMESNSQMTVKEIAVKSGMRISDALRLLRDESKFYVFRVMNDDMRYMGSFDENLLNSAALSLGCEASAGDVLKTKG